MRLYIVRHGEAMTPPGGGERTLTRRGVEEVQVAAGLLAGEPVDGMLHSPLLRTRQTATLLLEAQGDLPVAEEPCLVPPVNCQQVADAAEAFGGSSLVLVSHLPLVAELVGWFTRGDPGAYTLPGFPSGGIVVLDMELCGRGLASIAWYAFPPEYARKT